MEYVRQVYIKGKLYVGTTDVMDWADEHPDVCFDCTHFDCDAYPHYGLIVSDSSEDELFPFGTEKFYNWHSLSNGWQRVMTMDCMWVCRKDGRYIYITN